MSSIKSAIQKRVAANEKEQTQLRAALYELAASGLSVLGDGEKLIFESAGWDDRRIRREFSRAKTAHRLKQIAGSDADRQALHARAVDASELLNSEGEELRQQIEAAEKRLNKLQRDAELNQRRCNEACEAFEKLRDDSSLPDFICEQIRKTQQRIEGSIGRELGDRKVDLQELVVITSEPGSGSHDSDERYRLWLDSVERFDRRYVVAQPVDGGKRLQRRLTDTYREELPKLLEQKDALEAKVAQLNERLQSELTDGVESLRDFWLSIQ